MAQSRFRSKLIASETNFNEPHNFNEPAMLQKLSLARYKFYSQREAQEVSLQSPPLEKKFFDRKIFQKKFLKEKNSPKKKFFLNFGIFSIFFLNLVQPVIYLLFHYYVTQLFVTNIYTLLKLRHT